MAPHGRTAISGIKAGLERGRSVEDVAGFLCRSGSAGEVRRKATELGLNVPD
jgi:hypothetical protein